MPRPVVPDGEPWRTGRTVCQRLHHAGFEAWWVGGCVRDVVLGRVVSDLDVCTSATPEQVEKLFPNTVTVGRQFGVCVVLEGDQRIEVATFRADGVYIDGRRPTGVVYTDAAGDVARRDFTINALLMDPITGAITDHVGGLDDLEQRVLRVVGDPVARLTEDRLRILRGLRFAAGLDLTWDGPSWAAVCATPLTGISPERILQEIDKGLACASPAAWLKALDASGHLPAVLPTTDVEGACARLAHPGLGPDARLVAAWGGANGLPWAKSMPFSRERQQRLRFLHEGLSSLLTAPVAHRRRSLRHPDGPHLAALVGGTALAWLATEPPVLPLLITPNDLLALGIPPGPALGNLLRDIEDAHLEGRLTTPDQARHFALETRNLKLETPPFKTH